HVGETKLAAEALVSETLSPAVLLPDVQAREALVHNVDAETLQRPDTQVDEATVSKVDVARGQARDSEVDEIVSEQVRPGDSQFEALPNELQPDHVQAEGDHPGPVRPWTQLVINGPNGEETVLASHILIATGRRPNLDGLSLEAAHIKY